MATHPIPDSSAAMPRQIGRYLILRQLGAGAMGRVFLAHDTKLDRRIALKVPSIPEGDDGDDGEMARRFVREARAAASLEHPNICSTYDVGNEDGLLYVTMAYIKGRKLSHVMQKQQISPRNSAAIVRKVALALEHAHQHGVIHRDIKPDNIMLNESGEPFVMDFGIAQRTNGDNITRLTQTGTLMGTPAYMSPEQIDSDLEVDQRTDIYSLGVTLYEMLTGHIPFEGSVASVIHGIMAKQPLLPSEWNPGVDRALESVCLKMMAKDRATRYPTMASVATALEDWRRIDRNAKPPSTSLAEPARAPTETTETETISLTAFPTLTQPVVPPRKRRSMSGIVAVIVLSLAAATVYWVPGLVEHAQVIVKKDEQGTTESVLIDLAKGKTKKRGSVTFRLQLDEKHWNTRNIKQLEPQIEGVLGNGFEMDSGNLSYVPSGEIHGTISLTMPAGASPAKVARLLETVRGVKKAARQ